MCPYEKKQCSYLFFFQPPIEIEIEVNQRSRDHYFGKGNGERVTVPLVKKQQEQRNYFRSIWPIIFSVINIK